MEDRWSFMRPWCNVLYGRLHILQLYPGYGSQSQSFGLCVRLSIFARSAMYVPQLPYELKAEADMLTSERNALILLDMVARVDREAWKFLLIAYCGVNARYTRGIFEGDGLQSCYVFSLGHYSLGNASWANTVFSSVVCDRDSPDDGQFVATVHQIVALGATGEPGTPGERLIDVPVTIRLQILNYDDSELIMQGVRTLVDAFGGQVAHQISSLALSDEDDSSNEPVFLRCSFVLRAMEVNVENVVLTASMAKLMEMLVATHDVKLISAQLRLIFDDDRQGRDLTTVGAIGQMLERVLGGPANDRQERVLRLELDCVHADLVQFAGLCSALSDVPELLYMGLALSMRSATVADRVWMWQWLTYLLFLRSSCSKIALFGVCIGPAEIEAITSVMTSDNPLELILRSRPDICSIRNGVTGNALRFVRMAKGLQIVIHEMHSGQPIASLGTWTLGYDVEGAVLLDEAEENGEVTVLVPGYGVCKSSAAHVAPAPTSVVRRSQSDVSALWLGFETVSDAAAGLPQFLQTFGQSLMLLELTMLHGNLDLDGALRNCRNLRTLLVRGGVQVNTASFLRTYQDSQLTISTLECDFDDMMLFTRELSSPSTRLAQNLRGLSYTCHGLVRRNENRVMEALAAMLDVNRILQQLALAGPLLVYSSTLPLLEQHDGELLPVADDQFPVDCCAALLSVLDSLHCSKMQTSDVKKSSPAMALTSELRLDVAALTLILQFAAPNARRHVWLSY